MIGPRGYLPIIHSVELFVQVGIAPLSSEESVIHIEPFRFTHLVAMNDLLVLRRSKVELPWLVALAAFICGSGGTECLTGLRWQKVLMGESQAEGEDLVRVEHLVATTDKVGRNGKLGA